EEEGDGAVAADAPGLDRVATRSLSESRFRHCKSARRVEIGGIAAQADGLWMSQIGRNLSGAVDGILRGKGFLIHDHDPQFTAEFRSLLADGGVECVRIPPRSPNVNAQAERFVHSINESYLERMIWFGEDALRRMCEKW
ncbi:MAG: hypothetical protein WCD04_21195, partial [Terriglobia bacterium]